MDTLQYVFPEFLTPSVTGSNINVMTLLRYKDYGSFYNWINIKSKKNVLALKQSLKKKKTGSACSAFGFATFIP